MLRVRDVSIYLVSFPVAQMPYQLPNRAGNVFCVKVNGHITSISSQIGVESQIELIQNHNRMSVLVSSPTEMNTSANFLMDHLIHHV